MRAYRIQRAPKGDLGKATGYLTHDPNLIADELDQFLDADDENEALIIQHIEVTPEEYEARPEFRGW